MSEEKKEVQKEVEVEKKPEEKQRMRQIIIETDGNAINLVKHEVAGNLELSAILQAILDKIKLK